MHAERCREAHRHSDREGKFAMGMGNTLDLASNTATVSKIENVTVERYKVPLEEVLVDAGHGEHSHFELVLCHIQSSDGIAGTGYTYTGGVGGAAIASMIEADIAPRLMGLACGEIEKIWSKLQGELHYVGRGGVLSFAISAIDIALWDVRCRREDAPLSVLLGKQRDAVSCYVGFIDLTYSTERQTQAVEEKLGLGFTAFKTKVGAHDLLHDARRVSRMRDMIGTDRKLMIDANYSYTTDEAIRFARSVEHLGIHWFEEPISPDEFECYGQIAEQSSIPLAMGENLHLIEEFERAVRYSKLSYLQPDASNIGGITGWLKVADLAAQAGLKVCSHGMHELHVSLLAAQPHAGMLEVHSFPIDQYTRTPLKLCDGNAIVPTTIGVGVDFDLEKLSPHLVYRS